jgi:predicted nuclease of predicted toxin-antitoxin system
VRLKLDENLPRDLADERARRGHDVDTVLDEHLGGRKDPVVVQAATDDERLVITLDRG